MENFSISQFLRTEIEQGEHNGANGSIIAEMRKNSSNLPMISGKLIPMSAMFEKRTLDAANQIPTKVSRYWNSLQPNDFLIKAGVNVYDNLTANERIPSGSGFTLEWPGITGSLSSEVTQRILAQPDESYRVGGMVEISSTLLKSNPELIDSYVKTEFAKAFKAELARVLLSGSNALNEPQGVLNTPEIAVNTFDTIPNYAGCLGIEKALSLANGINDYTYCVMSPSMAFHLRGALSGISSGDAAYKDKLFLGTYPVTVSNSVPVNTLFLGDFTRSSLGLHGVGKEAILDIFIDDFTQVRRGAVLVYFNAYVSTQLQPQAFAVYKQKI